MLHVKEDYTIASVILEDYSKALSVNAEVEADFLGFSDSPKVDFTGTIPSVQTTIPGVGQFYPSCVVPGHPLDCN